MGRGLEVDVRNVPYKLELVSLPRRNDAEKDLWRRFSAYYESSAALVGSEIATIKSHLARLEYCAVRLSSDTSRRMRKY
jgi:hypothetical protein